MGHDLATNRKDEMKKLIKDGTDLCDKLKQQASDGCQAAGERAWKEYCATQIKRDARRNRLDARADWTRNLSAILTDLFNSSPRDAATSGKWNKSKEEWETGLQLLNEEILEFNEENVELLAKI